MKKVLFALAISYASFYSFTQVLNPVKWEFSKKHLSNNEFELQFKALIDDTWHIYGQEPNGGMNPTMFVFKQNDNYELSGKVIDPEGFKRKFDEIFNMEYNLYSHTAVFKQKVKLLSDTARITGYIEFFSCDNQRCLPPKEAEFEFILAKPAAQVKQDVIAKKLEDKTDNKIEEKEVAQFDQSLIIEQYPVETKKEDVKENIPENNKSKGKGLLGIFIISFLGGLGALLTPCVYPIIPLTISFFMRGDTKRQQAIFKGLAFGISIIIIYTLIGFLAGLLKIDLTKMSSSWLANIIFFLIFAVFAASFFGMFELVLPSKWSNKIDNEADKGGVLGSFFMALATVLISFSCTGPIVGVLLGKSLQGEIIQPVIGMFGFGLAFAMPFTLLAIFPNVMKNLPKSGGWLNSVKVFFAFILLAFSLKFLSNIDSIFHLDLLTRDVFIAIWIVLFILLGIYLLGKIKFSHDIDIQYISIPRLILIIASFSFALYMVPGLFGAPLKGISFFLPQKTESSFDISGNSNSFVIVNDNSTICEEPKYADFLHLPHGLKGYFDYEQGIKCAQEINKPVFLDFKGHTCTNCKAMEERVWSDPEVLRRLQNDFVIIALYVDDRTKLPDNEIYTSSYDGKKKHTLGKKNADFQVTKFNTNALPFYAIIDHTGNLLTEPRTTDFDINKFKEFLDKGKEKFNN